MQKILRNANRTVIVNCIKDAPHTVIIEVAFQDYPDNAMNFDTALLCELSQPVIAGDERPTSGFSNSIRHAVIK